MLPHILTQQKMLLKTESATSMPLWHNLGQGGPSAMSEPDVQRYCSPYVILRTVLLFVRSLNWEAVFSELLMACELSGTQRQLRAENPSWTCSESSVKIFLRIPFCSIWQNGYKEFIMSVFFWSIFLLKVKFEYMYIFLLKIFRSSILWIRAGAEKGESCLSWIKIEMVGVGILFLSAF